jgi:glycogen(starch) synthase
LLKNQESDNNVFAFIWVPAALLNAREDIENAVSHYSMVADKIAPFLFKIEDEVIHGLYAGTLERVFSKNLKEFFSDEFRQTIDNFENVKEQIKGRIGALPICTHNLLVPNDAITTTAKSANLINEEGDRVKIIFMPIYLSRKDGFLNLDYFDAISATDVGIYPSIYEPFGYTPLEAASRCVIAITTDLTGYGYSLLEIQSNREQKNLGIKILRRHNRSNQEVVNDLLKMLYDISQLSQEELEKLKQNARGLAKKSDWSHLIKAYIDAHTTAWERC